MFKTTVGKVIAILGTVLVVGGAIGGVCLYRFATPWLSAKTRMEELMQQDYAINADVEVLSGSIFPQFQFEGVKKSQQIHGDVRVEDVVWSDIYAGIGSPIYVNTRYVTEHFLSGVKSTLETVPVLGPMMYPAIEEAFPTGDRYMTMDQVSQLLRYVDLNQITGSAQHTSFHKGTYTSTDETAWGTYEVTRIDEIPSLPEDYTVESIFFRVNFANGNVVELSVPKDASEKSDYLVVQTASAEVHLLLHYELREISEFTYPTGSDFTEEDMQNIQKVLGILQEFQNT